MIPVSHRPGGSEWVLHNHRRMDRAFHQFVHDVLGYQARERGLVTSDGPGTLSFVFAQSLFEAMSGISTHTTWITTPYRDLDAPMEATVLEAIHSGLDVIIQSNATGIGSALAARGRPYRLGGQVFANPLYYLKAARRLRAFWFMVCSPDDFLRCLDVDYAGLAARSTAIAASMRRARRVHITSPNGTDLRLDLDASRPPNCDFDGTQHRRGSGGNLPMGEVFISPRIDSAQGTFVIDGSFNTQFPWTTVIAKSPVSLTFANGQLTAVEGGREARVFEGNVLEAEARTRRMVRQGRMSRALGARCVFVSRAVGEFAIGVNEKADIIGDLLIDEKRLGDAHIAVGRSYDGDPSLIHLDAIVRRPTVVVQYAGGREEAILEKGVVKAGQPCSR